jgi:hypothetical protein
MTGAQRFELGCCTATAGLLAACSETGESVAGFITRHAAGDWGEVCAEDAALNEAALERGERVLSAYRLGDGRKVYVVTEADRSYTTAMLAEEY